jgi:hypothetical protein
MCDGTGTNKTASLIGAMFSLLSGEKAENYKAVDCSCFNDSGEISCCNCMGSGKINTPCSRCGGEGSVIKREKYYLHD